MEGTKAKTMKTAEEFLNENGISFSQTSKDVFGNELLELMEQFRKEGMEEAYNYGSNLSDWDQESGDFLEFEEWYKQNIEK